MSIKYNTYVIQGVRYIRYDDHKILTANNHDYHKLRDQKTQWEQLSHHYEKTTEDCKQQIAKLKQTLREYEKDNKITKSKCETDYDMLKSKYEHALSVLDARTQELAKQNKEILALRDTIEALKFDRDVAMNKLDKTVEPTTRADKMRERVKCELCGKDLSRNSLRGHMKKMHIADGDDDDDVSITCLSGVD